MSALKGSRVGVVRDVLAGLLPEGPFYFPEEQHSDQPLEVALAELVREQALKRTREEVPHSIEVEVDEMERRDDGLTVVRAVLWAETESQKVILIGARRAHGARHRQRRAEGDRARARHPRATWT